MVHGFSTDVLCMTRAKTHEEEEERKGKLSPLHFIHFPLKSSSFEFLNKGKSFLGKELCKVFRRKFGKKFPFGY